VVKAVDPLADATPAAPGSSGAGMRAAQIMLTLGVAALVAAAISHLTGGTSTLLFAFGGLLAIAVGASLFVARSTASVLIRKRSFWLLALGAASSSVCGYGIAGWLPLFLMRSFGLRPGPDQPGTIPASP
jgi:hypothetical protein